MSAVARSGEEGDRLAGGRDAWFGALLFLVSGVVSLKCLGWATTIIAGYVMQ